MKTILIVDDLIDIRKLIRVTLSGAYEVLEAKDGATALQLIRHHHPCLVVLDIMMPGEMDGLQVLDAIRADTELKTTAIIMVTARGQAKDYDLGMSRGADAYFIKPFSPALLLDSIKELTQAHWRERGDPAAVEAKKVVCASCTRTATDPSGISSRKSTGDFCHGMGTVPVMDPHMPCQHCEGSGNLNASSCPVCRGAGVVPTIPGATKLCPSLDGRADET